MKRKWLHGIIVMLLLVVLGVCSFKTDSNVALAAESSIDLTTDVYEDSEGKYVSKEISTSETPELVTSGGEDWLFAGWYKAQECTKANAYRTKPTSDTAWAKFVPAEVLSVKVQVTKDAEEKKEASEKVDMRMVSSVDDLNYQNIGFEVSFNGGKFIDCSGNKEVYQRISSSSEANVEYNFSPKVVDTKSEYFITHTLTGIGPNSQDGTFLIRPYWVTLDGTTVYGINRTVKVSDSYSDVVSLSVKANNNTANNFTATVGNVECTISETRYTSGEKFADLIVSTDKDALASATKYEISDGTTVTYRNHYTSYNGAGTEDVSWYEVNKDAEEFVIATDADLYGLSQISASDTFAGKTVYVISDIAANSDSWSDMKSKIEDTDSTNDPYKWTQICKNEATPFSGTFDGQGHTISGLYVNGSSRQGMFGFVSGATITNFRLMGSYVKSVNGSDKIAGVVSTTKGVTKVSDIYTNATVNNTQNDRWTGTGGVVGLINDGVTTISNCCFAGEIISAGVNNGGIVGCAGSSEGTSTIIEHCLNKGSIINSYSSASYVSRTGGLCGGVISKNTLLTIKDSLSYGTITMNGNKDGGAIVGLVGLGDAGASVNEVDDSVYAKLNGNVTSVVGSIHATYGSVTGLDSKDVVSTNLVGYNGLEAVNLDYDKYWMLMTDGEPMLKSFADAGCIADLDFEWNTNETGAYEITTKEELYGLAYKVNTDATNFADKDYVLVADIELNSNYSDKWATESPKYEWIPIGTGNAFTGTFDGQEHTISGLYAKSTAGKIALFGTINGATVKNFSVTNSYFESSSDHVAGVIANAQNSTLSGIHSDATVVCTYAGEFSRGAGILAQGDTGTVTINNCWFDGTVTSSGGYNGGIVGRASAVTMNMSNCLNTGTISSTFTGTNKYTGGVIGGINSANTSIISVIDTLSAGTLKLTGSTACSGTAFGFIGYNANVTMSNVYATTNKAIISGAETTHVINVGSPDSGSITDLTGTDVTGFKSIDALNLAYGTTWTARKENVPTLLQFAKEDALLDTRWYNDTDKEFVIDTVAELYGLAYLSKTDSFTGKTVKLCADITVNKGTPSSLEAWNTYLTDAELTPWMVIGSSAKPFAGTFDGQGHTISGIYCDTTESYQGLFGVVKGATITNFRLEKSYFKTTGTHIASIAGDVGNTTISKIYSDAVVIADYDTAWARSGGLIAQVYEGTVSVSECWYNGYFKTTGGRSGGLVGWVTGAKFSLSNSMNTGVVETSVNDNGNEHVGGLIGGYNNAATTIASVNDCLSAGTLKLNGSTGAVGTVFGHLSYGASVTVNNVYATTNKAVISGTETAIKTIFNAGVIDKGNGVTDYTGYDMNGTCGYSLTALDFDTYWAVVTDGTPILKKFAKETPSTAGIPRFDLSWYSSSQTAFTISEAEQLHGLSYLVDKSIDTFSGDTIKLSADIIVNEDAPNTKEAWATYVNANTINWTPIGNSTVQFRGTFDGQGHSISGLYVKTTAGKIALFGDIRNAAVRNFNVENSYFETSENYVSGAVAYAQNSAISGIYSNVIVVSTDVDAYARAAGILAQGDTGTVTISECWFDGSITSAGGRNGGIVGWAAAVTMNISNCLNTGTVSSSYNSTNNEYTGGVLGGAHSNANTTVSMSNILSAGTLQLTGTTSNTGTAFGFLGYNAKITVANVYATTSKAMIKGVETAHKINVGSPDSGSITDLTGTDITGYKALDAMTLPFGTTWTIRENNIPTITRFAGDAAIFDTSWYNDSDTEFVIDTAQELYGLAYISTTDNFVGKTVKLGADITDNADVAKPTRQWVMTIGTSGTPFAGTFDGQGHVISGLYAKTTVSYISLFGDVRNGSVGNFSVKNSYIESSGSHVSGAIAYAQNSTISDIYSNATVVTTNTGEFARAAGILSQGDTGTVTISNCWFDGTVTSAGGFNGGIVGRAAAVTMKLLHCLNTGKVSSSFTGTNKYTGGIIGGINSANTSIISVTDTLSAGTLQLTGTTTSSGTAFGFIGYNANVTVSNVYATTKKAIVNGVETTHSISTGSPDSGSITDLTDVSIIGKDALTNASGLDYDGYWMAVEGKTPVLKSFYAMAADTAWYDNAADDATEYTISTANELYGLAKLSVTESFAGKTIYLANDIALNDKDSTKYQWVTPIGTENNAFAGTFDGTGKTISGIHINSFRGRQGLFGNLTGTIQNVRLEDGSITTSGSQSGTVAGTVTATGNILNVYSNVNLVAKSASGYDHIGGFVGLVSASVDETVTINNCWFDGSIIAAGKNNGGYVGTVSGAKVTLNIAHCLNTGNISASYGASATGGICGQVLNSTVTITDTLNTGHLSFSTNEYQTGSVIGVINGTGNVTLSSVFTTREGFVKPTSQSLEGESYKGISGVFYQVTENDRFVGYFSDYNDFVGNGNYVTDRKLDFANYWALSKTGTPILQTFAAASDVYDIATVDTELLLTTWNSAEVTVTNAKDFGNSVYQITVSDENGYIDYVATLKDAGFTCIENTMDGMYSATCSKGEWIATVIHAAGTVNKTYISFSTGQSLSKNLSASATDTSVKADGAKNKLHMLQQEVDGNSMVIELKNGHFVVYDGGMAGELETLMSYMKNLAGTTDGKQNPVIIEAWVISHFHADHCGALGYVRNYPTNESVRGWLTDVKVEAVYVNEPNDLVKDYEVLNQTIKTVTDVYNGIRFLKDTEGNVTNVYHMQAGQRYYFGDITMDVVLSQELMTSIEMYTEDFGDSKSIDFNDTSTWIMFNVDGEKILLAADGNKVNMDYIMDVYSQEYLTIDVFQAPHHAANTYETFTNYCTVNDYVLFDGIYNPTSYTNWTGTANTEGANYYLMEVINENRKLVGIDSIITNSTILVLQGGDKKLYTYDTTPTIPYFYMNGKHTILTFTGTGITGEQVDIQ